MRARESRCLRRGRQVAATLDGDLSTSLTLKARRIRAAILLTGVIVVLIIIFAMVGGGGGKPAKQAAAPPPSGPQIPPREAAPGDPPHLQPNSDPNALPGNLLIADRANDRLVEIDSQGRVVWEFPRPGDLDPGQTFKAPSAAFFEADHLHVIVTSSDESVVQEIDLSTNKIDWGYGTPGAQGTGPNQLKGPENAVVLATGQVLIPDTKNCRIIAVNRDKSIAKEYGKSGQCKHGDGTLGSPNASFPLADSNYLVTEVNGSWVSEMTVDGKTASGTHPPGVKSPSGSNPVREGYITTDFSNPGKAMIVDRTGKSLWAFGEKSGTNALNKPSLAIELPNGAIAISDESNHRVIIVDRKSSKVVWQFGSTGKAGRSAGELNLPSGLSPAPAGL